MFKDYYRILEIDYHASQEDVKRAFKVQAIRWHPDKNSGIDTTIKMQEINEAYIILKDIQARERYDQEYLRFNRYKKEQEHYKKERNAKSKEAESKSAERSYEFVDETLHDWMSNAQRQAYDLAKKSLSELIGMTSAGLKAGLLAGAQMLLVQLGCGFLIIIIILLSSFF